MAFSTSLTSLLRSHNVQDANRFTEELGAAAAAAAAAIHENSQEVFRLTAFSLNLGRALASFVTPLACHKTLTELVLMGCWSYQLRFIFLSFVFIDFSNDFLSIRLTLLMQAYKIAIG